MAPPSSDAYAFKPGGSLKYKGGDAPTSGKKKKKSKSSASKDLNKAYLGSSYERERERGQSSEVDDAGEEPRSPVHTPLKTDAEKKFEEIRKKRMAERVAREAKRTHKEKVDQFNRDLENQTEHYDIPKVGPG